MIEVLKQRLVACKKDERHLNHAETRYWLQQYKLLAEDAIKAIAELESQEPVQDDHQSFIDSLPTDNDDKMFMQIDHWAHKSYKRHQSSVRGQAITAADAYESHIVWAALRWAKENRPPQRTKQEPDVVMHWHSHTWTIINPPPKNSDDVNLYYAPPQRTEPEPVKKGLFIDLIAQHKGLAEELKAIDAQALQRTWIELTDEEIVKIVNANSSKGLYLMAKAIEAKSKERNGYSI